MDVVHEEGLRGRTVIDAGGRVLGSVESLAVDVASWRVRALRVRLDRAVAESIGQAHRVFRAAVIEVPVEYVKGVGDTVVLERSLESFARPPEAPPAIH